MEANGVAATDEVAGIAEEPAVVSAVRTGGADAFSSRAVPTRVAGALLPHGRQPRGRRGPGAGNAAASVAGTLRLRGTVERAGVAVPDRDERLPRRDQAHAAAGQGRGYAVRVRAGALVR